jgi:hypothetical protein
MPFEPLICTKIERRVSLSCLYLEGSGTPLNKTMAASILEKRARVASRGVFDLGYV